MEDPEAGHTPITQLRPRFQFSIEHSAEEVARKVNEALQEEDCPCLGVAHDRYARLNMPLADRHYWSPELALTFEEQENGTLIRGLFGPRPAVWTMFVFFYSVIAFAVLILSTLAASMYTMGKSIAFLWSVPVLALIFLSLYHVAYIGKKKGHGQSEVLYGFFLHAIGQADESNK